MNIEIKTAYSFHQLGNREVQEDSLYPDLEHAGNAESRFFAVCDGVGGCEKGEVASATVCRSIASTMDGIDTDRPFNDIDMADVLAKAYDALKKETKPENEGMATTLTFLCVNDGGCYVAHMGDSRVYQIRPGEGIVFRTVDHSLVNSLLRSGNITPDEADDHPRSNVITRCMSADQPDEATAVNLTDVAEGDYFMLFTDGVTHCVSDNELVDILSSEATDEDKMKRIAEMSADSADNNTAILVRVGRVQYDPAPETETTGHDPEKAPATKRIQPRTDVMHDVAPAAKRRSGGLRDLFNSIFR